MLLQSCGIARPLRTTVGPGHDAPCQRTSLPSDAFDTHVMTPDTSRLAEAIRTCDMGEVVKAMDEMTGVLHGLFETMETFRSEMIHVLKHPPREWTIAMDERKPERTRCEACHGVAENLAEAVDDDWGDLRAEDGESWEYVGLCPACCDARADAPDHRGIDEASRARAKHALQELLNCAELNQDDIEEETRALIAQARGRLNPLQERITCFECSAAPPPSLAMAIEQGWRYLEPVPNSAGHYLGLCPACCEAEMQRDFEEAERRRRGRRTENKTLFDC